MAFAVGGLAALRLDGWTAAPFLGPPIPQAATPFLVTTGGLVVAAAVAWGMTVLTGFRGIRGTPGPMPVPAMTSAVLALLVAKEGHAEPLAAAKSSGSTDGASILFLRRLV